MIKNKKTQLQRARNNANDCVAPFFKDIEEKEIINYLGMIVQLKHLSLIDIVSLYNEWLMSKLADDGKLREE